MALSPKKLKAGTRAVVKVGKGHHSVNTRFNTPLSPNVWYQAIVETITAECMELSVKVGGVYSSYIVVDHRDPNPRYSDAVVVRRVSRG